MAPPRTLADLAADDDASDPEDGDYVPAAPKVRARKGAGTASRKRDRAGSASGSDSSDGEDSSNEVDVPDAKRGRVDGNQVQAETEEERRERRRKEDEKWKAQLEGGDEGGGSKPVEGQEAGRAVVDEEMVEIRKPRKFAGEVVYETVRLPASHPDVQKYRSAGENGQADASTTLPNSAPPPTAPDPSAEPAPAASSSAASPPARRPPPVRRKPRQSLEAMNAALASGQGKKMTTLEKSQLDWKSHTSALDAAAAAELEANRKQGGGGYLEKREFLDRVGERVEQNAECGIKGRRR